MDPPNINYTPPGSVPNTTYLNTHSTLPFTGSPSYTTSSITNSTNAQSHRSGDGIYCARNTCKSKSGTRTKGHKECTNHLCKRCCQEAASLARNSGVFREPCHEPKHRLRAVAGSLTIHPTPEPFTHSIVSQDPLALVAPSMDGARAATVGAATHYAMPLATMWQPASDGWLANRQQAAKGEDDRRNIKKLALESRQTRGMQITTISWTAVSFEIPWHPTQTDAVSS